MPFSMESIRKGYLFYQKCYIKGLRVWTSGWPNRPVQAVLNYVFCTYSHEASGNIDQYSSLDGMFTKLVHRKLDNALAFYDYDRRCPFIQLGEKTQCGVKFLA